VPTNEAQTRSSKVGEGFAGIFSRKRYYERLMAVYKRAVELTKKCKREVKQSMKDKAPCRLSFLAVIITAEIKPPLNALE